MAQDPAFLLYYKDILVSCASWDEGTLGWYMRLLCHQADKPEGLPNDIEDLAALACVKFSQFEKFKKCWKHTLEARFELNDKGLLIDKKQAKVLKERKEYTDKQRARAIIGVYLRDHRQDHNLTNTKLSAATKALILNFDHDKYDTEKQVYIKNSLEAYASSFIGNVNADAIINEELGEGGPGEEPSQNPETPQQPKKEVPSYLRDQVAAYFGFTETANFDKIRIIQNFLEVLVHTGKDEYFERQMAAYAEYKRLSEEIKHSFSNFIGTAATLHIDGGWNAENWEDKLATFKQTHNRNRITAHSGGKKTSFK